MNSCLQYNPLTYINEHTCSLYGELVTLGDLPSPESLLDLLAIILE